MKNRLCAQIISEWGIIMDQSNIVKKGLSVMLAVLICLAGLQVSAADVSAVGKATVTLGKRTKTTAVLKIKKTRGVTGCHVYCSLTKKGPYHRIGPTLDSRFTLRKLKKNKEYYVKVRTYHTSGYRITMGGFSRRIRIGKFVEVPASEKYAAKVLTLINERRGEEDLPALKMKKELNAAASIRAKELAETDSSIVRPDGRDALTVLTDEEIGYEVAGENTDIGSATPAEAVRTWMQDDGYRAQILNGDYKYMGLGYYDSSKGDQYYWSLILIR